MNQCNIVRDLMPLQGEDLLSPDSVEFIRQHISTCPECLAIWERNGEALPEIQVRDPSGEKAVIRKALRRDRLKTVVKTLVAVLLMLLPLLGYTFLTLRQWGYFFPIEATYPSPDGSQILELVEPDHLLNPGEGYLLRFRLPKGYLNRYPTNWTSIEPHWAPDNTHLLLMVTNLEEEQEIRIVDASVMLTQGGTWDIPGMTENLIPILTDICREDPNFPDGWTHIRFSFDAWEEDSEHLTFRCETDLGQTGQITYHFPGKPLTQIP